MDALVTTQWLADAMDASDLRVADATYFLPDQNRDARAEFSEAHIPGAVFLNLAELRDTGSPLPSMLPPAPKFASRMQALGIGDGCRIVLYDNAPLKTAARAWWMFRAMGVTNVAVLDGGLAKWEAEGRRTDSGAQDARPRHLTPDPDAGAVRTLDQMRANVDTGAEQVVDARSPERFTGEEEDPRPGVAAGHIPGALNLHYSRLFHSDGTWKQGDELRAAFEDAGVDLDRPIVTTCGSGITASILAFGAHLLGRDAAVYDGSWSEWGADPSTPKAMGEA